MTPHPTPADPDPPTEARPTAEQGQRPTPAEVIDAWMADCWRGKAKGSDGAAAVLALTAAGYRIVDDDGPDERDAAWGRLAVRLATEGKRCLLPGDDGPDGGGVA